MTPPTSLSFHPKWESGTAKPGCHHPAGLKTMIGELMETPTKKEVRAEAELLMNR